MKKSIITSGPEFSQLLFAVSIHGSILEDFRVSVSLQLRTVVHASMECLYGRKLFETIWSEDEMVIKDIE